MAWAGSSSCAHLWIWLVNAVNNVAQRRLCAKKTSKSDAVARFGITNTRPVTAQIVVSEMLWPFVSMKS